MKFTHVGIEKGADNRTSPDYKQKVNLRETKRYWITEEGSKYKKTTGRGLGDWPMYSLDLNSVESKNNLKATLKTEVSGGYTVYEGGQKVGSIVEIGDQYEIHDRNGNCSLKNNWMDALSSFGIKENPLAAV